MMSPIKKGKYHEYGEPRIKEPLLRMVRSMVRKAQLNQGFENIRKRKLFIIHSCKYSARFDKIFAP